MCLKQLLLIIGIIVISTNLFSQSRGAKIEEVKEIKDRELIVLLRSANEKDLGKLKDKASVAQYHIDVQKLNDSIKLVFDEFWTFHKPIHYLTAAQIYSLPKPANYYAIMSVDVIRVKGSFLGLGTLYRNIRMSIHLLEDFDPLKPVYFQDMVGMSTEEGAPVAYTRELIFSTLTIQNHLEAVLAGKKRRSFVEESTEFSGILENKILLVDSIYLDPKQTEKKVFADYPYEYKICSHEDIARVQLARDQRYAYVVLFPLQKSSQHLFFHMIMDCELGKSISYSYQTAMNVVNFVNKKHLKNYVKFAERGKKKK